MGWYTEYKIVVDLKECMTSEFADELDDKLDDSCELDFTVDNTKVTFTSKQKGCGLSQLEYYMDLVSRVFDGMFEMITGTFKGEDAYAESQITDLCRKMTYRVMNIGGNEYRLMIRKYYDLPDEQVVKKLDANGKRLSLEEEKKWEAEEERIQDEDEQVREEKNEFQEARKNTATLSMEFMSDMQKRKNTNTDVHETADEKNQMFIKYSKPVRPLCGCCSRKSSNYNLESDSDDE